MSIYCDVGLGFNRKIGHFGHLNHVKREKVTFRYKYDIEYNGLGLARLCSTISVEPAVRENHCIIRVR